jgi:hypothetical protein
MTVRTVVYDAGMLVALQREKSSARLAHRGFRKAPHRPILIGPVLAQIWRPEPKSAYAVSQYLKDCAVPQARDSASPVREAVGASVGCVACTKTLALESYKRAGAMLTNAKLPAKKRPDVVDALVVVAAALHGPALIYTSDPDDISAYAATLEHADIVIEHV